MELGGTKREIAYRIAGHQPPPINPAPINPDVRKRKRSPSDDNLNSMEPSDHQPTSEQQFDDRVKELEKFKKSILQEFCKKEGLQYCMYSFFITILKHYLP